MIEYTKNLIMVLILESTTLGEPPSAVDRDYTYREYDQLSVKYKRNVVEYRYKEV